MAQKETKQLSKPLPYVETTTLAVPRGLVTARLANMLFIGRFADWVEVGQLIKGVISDFQLPL